mmetsp:Transcript_21998/g.34488  ORF Transcript_21998/g.34488 Transcript_21998/m.34488 type:complete len:234 (+) Transcript_21998:708-1409(+)
MRPDHFLTSFCTPANASFRLATNGMVRSIVTRMTQLQSPKDLSCANLREFTSIEMLSAFTSSSTPRRTMSSTSCSNVRAPFCPESSSSSSSSSSSDSPSHSSSPSSSSTFRLTSSAIRDSVSSSSGFHTQPLPSSPTTALSVTISSSSLSPSSKSSSPKSSSSSSASLLRFAAAIRVPSLILTPSPRITPPPITEFFSTSTPLMMSTSSQTMQSVSLALAPIETLAKMIHPDI